MERGQILDMLNGNACGFIEISNYHGKLLMLWDKFVDPGSCEDKDIWCAMISIERRDDTDEVWGNIEWANVVLTVPRSCVFMHSMMNIH
ncbi:putative F-box/kelch-repeat protein [Cardamine amara subsp. amara]|uniref:F-box/kelch-repeat protein n=1 Tax=Cardamine amara subsp. amara TaxID=228776 RepID=A0ABD1C792_CARAN